MQIRLALLLVIWTMFLGCTPPNTPEPPPPPPVAGSEPVSQIPPDPSAKPPAIEPKANQPASTKSPVDPNRTTTDPIPPKPPVNVAEQIEKLTQGEDRQGAAVTLASAGKVAVPALLKALEHADWQVRAAAVFALGQIGSDAGDAKSQLQTIADKDENASVRDAAAFALDAIEGK